MNLLKKKYKLIIAVISSVLLIVICVIILLKQNPNKCEFITLSNDYYVVNSNNNNTINVPIYVSELDSEFMKKENIDKIYIFNNKDEDKYQVNLEYCTFRKEAVYEGDTYYQYDVKLDFLFSTDELLTIEDAYLEIFYPNDIIIKLKIGSIIVYNYYSNECLGYSNLKGLVKTYQNTTMLTGVLVKLYNLNKYRICGIKCINNYAEINTEYTKKVEYVSDESTPLDSFIDNKFNIIGNNVTIFSIDMKEEEYIFIALNYNSYISSPCIGFIIEYEQDGKMYEKVISPFKFYKEADAKYELNRVTYEANFN